uniref:Uncharacterized protein n=1 Tax=Heterosigma akashiwo TaxID=2829 RepID=A0A7S3XLG8_HETAK
MRDGDLPPLVHPKYKINLNVRVKDDLRRSLIEEFIGWRQEEWIREVDKRRAHIKRFNAADVKRGFRCEKSMTDINKYIGGLAKKNDFPMLILYSRLKPQDFVNLMKSAQDATVAAARHRRKLYASVESSRALVKDVGNMISAGERNSRKIEQEAAKMRARVLKKQGRRINAITTLNSEQKPLEGESGPGSPKGSQSQNPQADSVLEQGKQRIQRPASNSPKARGGAGTLPRHQTSPADLTGRSSGRGGLISSSPKAKGGLGMVRQPTF